MEKINVFNKKESKFGDRYEEALSRIKSKEYLDEIFKNYSTSFLKIKGFLEINKELPKIYFSIDEEITSGKISITFKYISNILNFKRRRTGPKYSIVEMTSTITSLKERDKLFYVYFIGNYFSEALNDSRWTEEQLKAFNIEYGNVVPCSTLLDYSSKCINELTEDSINRVEKSGYTIEPDSEKIDIIKDYIEDNDIKPESLEIIIDCKNSIIE